ncbi:MAG: hypothetical protein AAB365_04150 [Patescibacteria group bacterium]
MKQDWKKYALAFVITAAIFTTAILISSKLNDGRLNELRALQDSVSINILSSETQFNLLKEAACDDLFSSSLGQELGNLADRLSYMESVGRGNDDEVVTLKRYYSLLQIKDYLLITGAASKCAKRPLTILYFYRADCPDCAKQGQVLTYIRQHSPENIRIYSFDYDLDVSALKTLANINKVKEPFPALIIKGKTYSGFKSIEDMEALVPELVATSTAKIATSTAAKK